MEQIGIVANLQRNPRCEALIRELAVWFEQRGMRVIVPERLAGRLPGLTAGELNDSRLIITLGGDGTLLGTARQVAGWGIPILGVNMGHLGFLTDLESAELFPNLIRLAEGDYRIEPRLMLESAVLRKGEQVGGSYALNDVVVTKGTLSRILVLETYAGAEYLSTYRADGLIIATPTGSTAYSLSAGGPIVSPQLGVLMLTPICPHTLYARPFILADDLDIRIVLKSGESEAMLTVDGQIGFHLQPNDQVVVRKAPIHTNLIKLKKRSFFEVLRLKLREGDH